jgi:biotin synthase-like enzyme
MNNNKKVHEKENLVQGIDYYINEKGQWVFTELFHLKRGYCCKNDCLHCPYGFHKQKTDFE